MRRRGARPVSGLTPEMMEAAGRFHREVTRGKRCARCGRARLLEAHHVVPKQTLKQEIDNERHVDVLYDPRNGLALCAICHERHTNASDRVPRSLVPAAAWGFAAEHGFEWLLEAQYPEDK